MEIVGQIGCQMLPSVQYSFEQEDDVHAKIVCHSQEIADLQERQNVQSIQHLYILMLLMQLNIKRKQQHIDIHTFFINIVLKGISGHLMKATSKRRRTKAKMEEEKKEEEKK